MWFRVVVSNGFQIYVQQQIFSILSGSVELWFLHLLYLLQKCSTAVFVLMAEHSTLQPSEHFDV
jgi:hypothetical protein